MALNARQAVNNAPQGFRVVNVGMHDPMAIARLIHRGAAIRVMGDAMVMEFGMTMGRDRRDGIVQGDSGRSETTAEE